MEMQHFSPHATAESESTLSQDGHVVLAQDKERMSLSDFRGGQAVRLQLSVLDWVGFTTLFCFPSSKILADISYLLSLSFVLVEVYLCLFFIIVILFELQEGLEIKTIYFIYYI